MAEDKKPFKDTKFWQFVTEKVKPIAGDVLEVVGDITGRESIERVGQLLNNRKEGDAQIAALSQEFEMKKLEWEMEFQKLEMQAEIDAFRLEVEDKQDARSAEIERMKQLGGKRDWVQGGLVIFTMALLAAMIFMLCFYEIPQSNRDVFNVVLGGTIVGGAQSIYNYFFGSSRGSASKEKVMSKAMEK